MHKKLMTLLASLLPTVHTRRSDRICLYSPHCRAFARVVSTNLRPGSTGTEALRPHLWGAGETRDTPGNPGVLSRSHKARLATHIFVQETSRNSHPPAQRTGRGVCRQSYPNAIPKRASWCLLTCFCGYRAARAEFQAEAQPICPWTVLVQEELGQDLPSPSGWFQPIWTKMFVNEPTISNTGENKKCLEEEEAEETMCGFLV